MDPFYIGMVLEADQFYSKGDFNTFYVIRKVGRKYIYVNSIRELVRYGWDNIILEKFRRLDFQIKSRIHKETIFTFDKDDIPEPHLEFQFKKLASMDACFLNSLRGGLDEDTMWNDYPTQKYNLRPYTQSKFQTCYVYIFSIFVELFYYFHDFVQESPSKPMETQCIVKIQCTVSAWF